MQLTIPSKTFNAFIEKIKSEDGTLFRSDDSDAILLNFNHGRYELNIICHSYNYEVSMDIVWYECIKHIFGLQILYEVTEQQVDLLKEAIEYNENKKL